MHWWAGLAEFRKVLRVVVKGARYSLIIHEVLVAMESFFLQDCKWSNRKELIATTVLIFNP